jgi:plasmid stabilization system protein ParE
MTSYILAPEALQDLQELWDYIATENLDAADRLIDTLSAAFERLATRLCRKFCSGGREGVVAPVGGEIRRPGSRTVRPQ